MKCSSATPRRSGASYAGWRPAFAFYRGTACLFYSDLERDRHGGLYLDERTGRVWIHGENFGMYMDSNGRLTFNVTDFDEVYVGAFTLDLKRFAASVALIGYTKALSALDAATRYKVLAAFDGYLCAPTPTGSRTWSAAGASASAPRACPSTTSCWRGTATPWRTTS